MRAPALLLALLLAAAGCLSTPEDAAPEQRAAQEGVEIVEDRPDTTYTDVRSGTIAGADENATLDAPPQLRPGEWWRIRTESPFAAGSAEYVRVMAEITDTGYVFGMPHEGWYKEAVIFHVPFFGDVGFDLSGQAHDIPIVPLKFPLVDGATWTMQYMGPPDLTALVDADEEAKTARVTFTDPDGNVALELVYDAKIHEIVELHHPMLSYTVLEHGYDFEGWVTVPRAMHTPILHGRIGPLDANGQPNPSKTDTVEIEGGYNRMSMVIGRGDLGLVPPLGPANAGGTGVFGVTVTDPAGESFGMEPAPMTGGFEMAFFESPNVDGTWTIDYTSVGSGAVFLMGIVYHQYDIELPSGAKRSDHAHPVVR